MADFPPSMADFPDPPPSYKFIPTGNELVGFYLKRKLANLPLPRNTVIDGVNIYQFNPQELSERYKRPGEYACYFFTPKERKYKNESEQYRLARRGYWKAITDDKPVIDTNKIHVGYKKTLVFYRGKTRKRNSVKTNWIMREYRLYERVPRSQRGANDTRLDDLVVCAIYNKRP